MKVPRRTVQAVAVKAVTPGGDYFFELLTPENKCVDTRMNLLGAFLN